MNLMHPYLSGPVPFYTACHPDLTDHFADAFDKITKNDRLLRFITCTMKVCKLHPVHGPLFSEFTISLFS